MALNAGTQKYADDQRPTRLTLRFRLADVRRALGAPPSRRLQAEVVLPTLADIDAIDRAADEAAKGHDVSNPYVL